MFLKEVVVGSFVKLSSEHRSDFDGFPGGVDSGQAVSVGESDGAGPREKKVPQPRSAETESEAFAPAERRESVDGSVHRCPLCHLGKISCSKNCRNCVMYWSISKS